MGTPGVKSAWGGFLPAIWGGLSGMGRIVRRYLPWMLVGLVVVGLGLILAARQMLPGWVEDALTKAAWAEGLPGAQVTLTDLTPTQASGTLLLDTRCAPACNARFMAGYSLGGLWARQLDKLVFSDLSLTGWPEGALGRPAGTRWRLPPIEIRNIAVALPDNPLMPLAVQLGEGTLIPASGGGWQARGRASLTSGALVLASLDIRLERPLDQPLMLELVATPEGRAPAAAGRLKVQFMPDGMPLGEGRLQLENLELLGISPLRLNLSARAEVGGTLLLDGVLDLPDGPDALGLLRAGQITLSLAGNKDRLQGTVNAQGVGIADGPRDNYLKLPLALHRQGPGWQLESQTGGSLLLPTLGVMVDGLALTVPDPAGGLLVTAERLQLGSPLPVLAPVRPQLHLVLADKGRWGARLMATDPLGQPLLRGEAEWQAGQGYQSALEILPQTFGQGGQTLAALSPWLAQWIAEPSGRIGLRLTQGRDGDGATGSARLLLDQVGFRWPGGRVDGLSGIYWFDSLSPLAAPAQPIWLGRLQAGGLALHGGAVTFELRGDGNLDAGPAELRWAGLLLRTDGTRFSLGGRLPPLVLHMPATPLEEVLTALGITPVNAAGLVAGHLTLPLGDGSLPLGGVQAEGSGSIAWQGREPAAFLATGVNDSPALVAAALRNYRFQQLSITPTSGGPVLRLEGSNPDLYGGYAMGLSLHLNAPKIGPPPARPDEIERAVNDYLKGN
jgi:hypothetical protein